MKISNIEMLPCPFCGRNDLKIINIESEDVPGSFYAKAVFCMDCHCTGRHNNPIGWCESDLEAIEAWNDRDQRLNSELSKKESIKDEYYINQHMIPKKELKSPRYFFICYTAISSNHQGIKGHLFSSSSDGVFDPSRIIGLATELYKHSNFIITSVFEVSKDEYEIGISDANKDS